MMFFSWFGVLAPTRLRKTVEHFKAVLSNQFTWWAAGADYGHADHQAASNRIMFQIPGVSLATASQATNSSYIPQMVCLDR